MLYDYDVLLYKQQWLVVIGDTIYKLIEKPL
jgi:hypothetical protein